ncbi:uncharacterized protein LACBIDRAFT_230303, partial [Laccaria bicolor S238N-H82]
QKNHTFVPLPPLELLQLHISGPSSNRVDLVFFSDGYLQEEKDKFIQDAMRLVDDISKNQTFHTVKPLLNFWAAFSPSKETRFVSTPFGLYRDGTELRGVYYDKPEVAKATCESLASKCDYPILLGNDHLYGGLGGEFTVVTSSFLNGPLVLRLELGHSIIDVGEEYDGGFAYFGMNAAEDLSKPLPWEHWLTNPSPIPENLRKQTRRVERSVMPMQAYPWTMLNSSSPWSITFPSSGMYSSHLVRFSLSGLPEKSDLKVEIDGVDLGWVPEPNIGVDRWHYDIHRSGGLRLGEHEIKFTLLEGSREGIAQLCSVEVLEFGDEDEFNNQPGYYGIFPTFSDLNETSYRPTNEDCLMRVVTSPHFCKVCMEGLWLSLLGHIDLINDIGIGQCEQQSSGSWTRVVDLQLLPLAQFRTESITSKESYIVKWKKDGRTIREFTNQTKLEVDGGDAVGRWTVMIKFATEEVRVDDARLYSRAQFTIGKCGS